MPRGGARNRSGSHPDPNSGRSERRGIKFNALPAAGYDGDVPAFPLPPPEEEYLEPRELDAWAEAWRTPQAAAWAVESWRWPVVAEYIRIKVMCEASPNAALVAQLHRYRDQIGLTPAGLRENGWAIAHDEVQPRREEKAGEEAAPVKRARRLRAVAGDAE